MFGKIGKLSPNYGKIMSLDTKNKQSEIRKKYWENIRQERAIMIF